jgi:hypothetical protein
VVRLQVVGAMELSKSFPELFVSCNIGPECACSHCYDEHDPRLGTETIFGLDKANDLFVLYANALQLLCLRFAYRLPKSILSG